ncbi:MAG: hypothetical protein R3A11_06640 [Bdellovibrionota bacterium]
MSTENEISLGHLTDIGGGDGPISRGCVCVFSINGQSNAKEIARSLDLI